MDEQVKIKAPGQADRHGTNLFELLRMLPIDKAAERWLAKHCWPNRITSVARFVQRAEGR